MKEKYLKPAAYIEEFKTVDVITTADIIASNETTNI